MVGTNTLLYWRPRMASRVVRFFRVHSSCPGVYRGLESVFAIIGAVCILAFIQRFSRLHETWTEGASLYGHTEILLAALFSSVYAVR